MKRYRYIDGHAVALCALNGARRGTTREVGCLRRPMTILKPTEKSCAAPWDITHRVSPGPHNPVKFSPHIHHRAADSLPSSIHLCRFHAAKALELLLGTGRMPTTASQNNKKGSYVCIA